MLIFVAVAGILLLLAGASVYFFLGFPAALSLLLFTPVPPVRLTSILYDSLNLDILIVVPTFLFVGNLLGRSGTSKYLFDFFDTLLRPVPGGLAIVTVFTCMFFAGMTGSSTAESAAIASVVIPPMIAAGYDRRFVMGLVAAGGTLGIMIPPSNAMIIYALIAEGVSIGELFIAGILPGIFIGSLLIGASLVNAWRSGYGRRPMASLGEHWRSFVKAVPILLVPVLILGGIYMGFATPSEVGAIAAVYTILITTLVYRTVRLQEFVDATLETVRMASMVLFIVAFSSILSFVLVYQRIPQLAVEWVVAQHLSSVMFLLAVNALLIIMGIPIEPLPILLVTVPILFPLLKPLGISPIHFGIIMVVNMQLALISPPVGAVLFVVASVARAPAHEIFRGVLPFFLLLVGALLVITLWPDLSLLLPRTIRPVV